MEITKQGDSLQAKVSDAQRKALERAIEMLGIAGTYSANGCDYMPDPVVFYDGAECDGGSIEMDCENAILELTRAFGISEKPQ